MLLKMKKKISKIKIFYENQLILFSLDSELHINLEGSRHTELKFIWARMKIKPFLDVIKPNVIL